MLHDNSAEMWNNYYSSEGGSWLFAKLIHYSRKIYFKKIFVKRIIQAGGPSTSYLEIGVGSAQTLTHLQKKTNASCVGIEKNSLAYEIGKAQANNCKIILGDALELPFEDNSFDVVYSLGLLEHFELEQQHQLLKEQSRVARRKILFLVPTSVWHMRTIIWFNRVVLKRKGVWADDELFSKRHFRNKFPELKFEYYFDWASGGITCWFSIKSEDLKKYFSKSNL